MRTVATVLAVVGAVAGVFLSFRAYWQARREVTYQDLLDLHASARRNAALGIVATSMEAAAVVFAFLATVP